MHDRQYGKAVQLAIDLGLGSMGKQLDVATIGEGVPYLAAAAQAFGHRVVAFTSSDDHVEDATAMETKPNEWHRRPANSRGPCSICGFPSEYRGLHRRVEDPGAVFPRFVKRLKSPEGWREVVVDTTTKKSALDVKLEADPSEWHPTPLTIPNSGKK